MVKKYPEALYSKLPISLQHFICSVEGWRIQRRRFGSSFKILLEEAESRMRWPPEKVIAYRDNRLRDFVRHSFSTVPFYRQRFKKWGVSPEDIRSLEDLKLLPILTKEEVKSNYPQFISETIPVRKHIMAHTSGTTGGGLRFATTLIAIQKQRAIWWRYRRWHGLDRGTWCGYFGGRSVVPIWQTSPPFWRYNFPGKQILFSGYHMSPNNLSAYVEELRLRRPPWLHGYPSLLALLASYILEKGVDLGYEIRWITIGAENLLPQQAELIERAFGVRPRQHYGMEEAVANFSECIYGALHVDEDFSAVEFVPNPEGEGYKVIGTNFSNPATPLIRYDVGDVVELGSGSCPCGLPGRIVKRVDGRQEDYVILKNGARLGRMDLFFKDMVAIREAQIYQNKPGLIIVRVVRSSSYNEDDEKRLLYEFYKRIGNQGEVKIEYVNRIERTKAGKLRFVISDLEEGRLTGYPPSTS